MRQETYRFAFEEANSELRDITAEYEQLQSRKEQVEKVLAALRPFLELGMDAPVGRVPVNETQFLFQATEPEMTFGSSPETVPELEEFLLREGLVQEQHSEPMHLSMTAEPEMEPELEAEPVAEMSSDPFQRRIDDVLRHGVGGRELRIHSRSLNGLLSRV